MALKTPYWKRKYEDVSMKDVGKLKRETDKRLFIFSLIFAVVIVSLVIIKFSLLGAHRSEVEAMAKKIQDKNVKIAVINKGSLDTFSHEYFTGTQQESESMGIKVRTLVANYDLTSFRYLLAQVRKENYDGVIIDGGNDAVVEEIKKLTDKGIPIVAFNSTSQLLKMKGITMTYEDNNRMMEYALANMFTQLKGKGNIAYLYANTNPSLGNRHKIYEKFLAKNAEIKEVDRVEIGKTEVFVKAKYAVAEMVKRHEKGKIDVIFATYGEMARGAAEAIKEAGRKDIKVHAIGFTDADLYNMQAESSSYVAATGIDLREIGAVNVRLLLKKIAGEKTPAEYKFKPSLIMKEELRAMEGTMNTDSLKKVVRGWGENDDFTERWMKKLKKCHVEDMAKT